MQIRGHVDDREEGNHDCRDAGRPQARLRVMVILQWTGTAGLGGPPAVPVGHNLPRPLGARLLPKLEPGWRVAEFVLRKTNLTFGGNKQLTKKLFRRPGRNARLLAGQLPSSFARTCCLDRIPTHDRSRPEGARFHHARAGRDPPAAVRAVAAFAQAVLLPLSSFDQSGALVAVNEFLHR